jgi:hypothetical protein
MSLRLDLTRTVVDAAAAWSILQTLNVEVASVRKNYICVVDGRRGLADYEVKSLRHGDNFDDKLAARAVHRRSAYQGDDKDRHARSLHTPHFPPSFAQCLQYRQVLQAWHGSEPMQVAEGLPAKNATKISRNMKMIWAVTSGLKSAFYLDKART